MADTRIVALVGSRQSGKATLARKIAAARFGMAREVFGRFGVIWHQAASDPEWHTV